MLEPYGQATGAVAASEVDKAPLVWQQRLTSSDALQNNVDMQGHTNSLSQVSHMFFSLLSLHCDMLLSVTFIKYSYIIK